MVLAESSRNGGTTTHQDHYLESPSKRRRISLPENDLSKSLDHSFLNAFSDNQAAANHANASNDTCETNANVSFSATSKQAGQTVAPFLAKHIPDQYAPMGGLDANGRAKRRDPNTKYCYRHQPDLKCRRQANEPSMDQLQQVRATGAPFYS